MPFSTSGIPDAIHPVSLLNGMPIFYSSVHQYAFDYISRFIIPVNFAVVRIPENDL